MANSPGSRSFRQEYRFGKLGGFDVPRGAAPQSAREQSRRTCAGFSLGTSLVLADGRESLVSLASPMRALPPPRPSAPVVPQGRRAAQPFATPRGRAAVAQADDEAALVPAAAAAAAEAEALDTGEELDPGGLVGSTYWLPPLTTPLNSRSATFHGQRHTLEPNSAGRAHAHFPARWSLSPTPISKGKKHRFTLPSDEGRAGSKEEVQRQGQMAELRREQSFWGEMGGSSIRTSLP